MSYSITFYFGTGLNAQNTVDTPAKLEAIATSSLNVPNCDILHVRGLSSITVAATYNSIKNADYLKASDGTDTAYFFITGDIVPTSQDVCTVPVCIDYWLTGGGIANTGFLDGITNRHHIPIADDTFGAYTEEDPYIVPSKPLEIVDGGLKMNYKATAANSVQLAEGLLDIGAMGETTATEAITYTDPVTGEKVTCPKTIPLTSTKRTLVEVGVPHEGSTMNTVTPNTCYFDTSNPTTQAGIGKIRDVGAEGSILNAWIVPSAKVSATIAADGRCSKLETTADSASSGLPFEYASVHNKRVLYGSLNRYVLSPIASGNSAEFNPEDIYHSGDVSPVIVGLQDPRPHGAPLYRPEYYKGSTEFFINYVPGLEWQTAPLVFYDKSGKEIDAFNFKSNRIYQQGVWRGQSKVGQLAEASRRISEDANYVTGVIGAGFDSAGVAAEGGFAQAMAPIGVAQVGLSQSYNIAARRTIADAGREAERYAYYEGKNKDLAQFNLTQSVVEPTLMFPRSETIRDFLGNGVRVYRYRFSASDVTKIDKILTMYGYKDTKPLEASDFTNRTKFNYVQASGISVSNNNMPRWIREGIAMQLSIGVRIWHVKPDVTAYTDGSNV